MQNISDFMPGQYGISKRDFDTGSYINKNPNYFEQIRRDTDTRKEQQKSDFVAMMTKQLNDLMAARGRANPRDYAEIDQRIESLRAYLQSLPSMSAEELFPVIPRMRVPPVSPQYGAADRVDQAPPIRSRMA
jgi:hypothetical protein